jgi:membrane associated rhomboid family serine protease
MAEFRPGGFTILPPVIKNLLIVNTLVFIAQKLTVQTQNPVIEQLFALHDVHSVYFKPWQLISYLFLQADFWHIFFNMFALWMFGSALENVWGSGRFLFFYLICGVGAGAMQLAILYDQTAPLMAEFYMLPQSQQDRLLYAPNFIVNGATIGASGAVFGCLAAFAYLFPNDYIYLYAFLPIKAKWFVLGYAAVELWTGIQNSAGDNVAHWAHLGGAAVGIIIVWIWNKTNRRRFY